MAEDNDPAASEAFAASPATMAVIEQLKASAVRRAGSDDFGPDDYMLPLSMILEEGLTKPNQGFWKEECEIALVGRLIREAEWKRNPGYKNRVIKQPLVICGIPRTGTTVLHKLLSVDRRFQGLDHWLTAWPMPRPPRATWADQPGFKHAVAIIEKRFEGLPEMKVSHDIVADEVDECLEVLRLDFVSNRFPSMTSLPRFDRWFQKQDETPYYRRLADTVRLIGLYDDRRWLLKNPGHFVELDSLFAVFPDACVVVTHRDPVKTIPSLCSVLSQSHCAVDPKADLRAMAKREIGYWSDAKNRTDAIRKTAKGKQVFDVQHKDFHADPIGTVKSIYGFAGIEMLPEVETAMRDWLRDNPRDKRGEHKYTLEQYGLNVEQLREKFGEG